MKKLTTYNLQLTTKKRGFTLLEVLIASTLFAMVMIMTTGTIASSSSYQAKLKAMRETGEDSRKLADMITEDVREADGAVKVQTSEVDSTTVHTYNSGIAFFNSADPALTLKYNTAPTNTLSAEETSSAVYAQFLVLAVGDKYKVYLTSRYKHHVYYKTFDRLDGSGNVNTLKPSDLFTIKNECTDGKRINRISSANTETEITFSGYAPDTTATLKQQAYVSFFITSKSKDPLDEDLCTSGVTSEDASAFNATAVNFRAISQVRSLVTSRNYDE